MLNPFVVPKTSREDSLYEDRVWVQEAYMSRKIFVKDAGGFEAKPLTAWRRGLPRGYSYSFSIRVWYFSLMAFLLSFIVGVISPPSWVKGWGRRTNFLIFS